jgi:hypothetical protein
LACVGNTAERPINLVTPTKDQNSACVGNTAESPINLVTPTKDQNLAWAGNTTESPINLVTPTKKRKREDSLDLTDDDDDDEKKGPTKKVKPLIVNAHAGTKGVRLRCTYRPPTPYASPE